MKTNLDGLDARVPKRDTSARTLIRVDQLPARRVRQELSERPPEELPDRQPRSLPDQIPDRGLGDPGTAAMEVDGLREFSDDLCP